MFVCGTHWRFGLTLVGVLALRQIPAVVAAVQQGADRGMGRMRLRSQLREVTALLPDGEKPLAAERPTADGAVLTWENFGLADVGFSMAQASKLVEVLPDPIQRNQYPVSQPDEDQGAGAMDRASESRRRNPRGCAPAAHFEPGAW